MARSLSKPTQEALELLIGGSVIYADIAHKGGWIPRGETASFLRVDGNVMKSLISRKLIDKIEDSWPRWMWAITNAGIVAAAAKTDRSGTEL